VASRQRSGAKIVAVTGSAGKTTTKEMLRLMLAACGPVAASAASYNNHWGVPLSLARMARDAAYGVFEIGMNHAGEIRALVKQVRPHVALITTIAPAHLEYFGNIEAIADAKAEIFEGLEKNGVAILPADNPQFARLKAHAQAAGVPRILSFGTQADADARLISAQPHGEGQKLIAEIHGERIVLTVGAAGAHIAMNAVAGLLAVRELGAEMDAAARALAGFTALKGRGARLAIGGIELIDESYNANPASMAAALDLLGQTQPKTAGRRIAVLGDMLELGANSADLHRGLADPIAAARADLVFFVRTPNGGALADDTAALPRCLCRSFVRSCAPPNAQFAHRRCGARQRFVGSRMSVIVDALKTRRQSRTCGCRTNL